MVLIEGRPICTSCGARGSAEGGVQPLQGSQHYENAGRPGSSSLPDEVTRLRVLLPHWVQYNEEHLNDLRRWAAIARDLQRPAADLLECAIACFETGNQKLAAALEALTG